MILFQANLKMWQAYYEQGKDNAMGTRVVDLTQVITLVPNCSEKTGVA